MRKYRVSVYLDKVFGREQFGWNLWEECDTLDDVSESIQAARREYGTSVRVKVEEVTTVVLYSD